MSVDRDQHIVDPDFFRRSSPGDGDESTYQYPITPRSRTAHYGIMERVAAAGDAVADVIDAEFDVEADIGDDDPDRSAQRLHDAVQWETPRSNILPVSVFIPGASGDAFMDVGGPPVGRLWHVRRYAVSLYPFGTLPTTVVLRLLAAGGGYGASGASGLNPELAGQLLWERNASPFCDTFSENEQDITYPQHLYVEINISGGSANGNQFAGTVSVVDEPRFQSPVDELLEIVRLLQDHGR